MRLLNVKTLKLEDFLSDKKRPKYAILSHTWLEEEVLFHHVENLERAALEKLKGFAKVKDSCTQAQTDGYDYIWIDTCCIDKSSSAELSEAINSMWTWYRQSDMCYGFLSDVKRNDTKFLYKSRWFRRGWTLQELIAPDNFKFDHSTTRTGENWVDVSNWQAWNSLCAVCGLPESIDEILRSISVASKMSWSARRETTRIEDRSYSLLGLFGVNLPLLYGEGEAAAWRRLLDEVIKKSNDQSVFAFDYYADYLTETVLQIKNPGTTNLLPGGGIYAESARRYTKNIQLPSSRSSRTMGLVAGDLVLEIWLCPLVPKDPSKWIMRKTYGDTFAGLLECKVIGDPLAWPVIFVKPITGTDNKFIRMPSNLLKIDMQGLPTFKACREPEKGETIKLGPIADDCTYDITKAKLRRITIVDYEPEGHMVNTINHITKPLQIMPISQPGNSHYKLDSSYPESQNGNIGTIPVFWGQDFMGMAIFSNDNRSPFVATWGPGPSQDERPWCKLFTLGKADPSKYVSQKHDLARTIRHSAWEEQEHKSLRLEDFKINYKSKLSIWGAFAATNLEAEMHPKPAFNLAVELRPSDLFLSHVKANADFQVHALVEQHPVNYVTGQLKQQINAAQEAANHGQSK
ncbi:hypothetical protein E0Z10_g3331 [Xylaria hypoxylon]|uniref:Heterokaryon incompatibility domain-containing protein n=1 Tax=Xylaria hypoxylon TaxID=37992 RepID=A0A4Z0Z156_9PEZI|nr:hypothetical protein E0Z10_g3331 [Xylaria hypoxylon]